MVGERETEMGWREERWADKGGGESRLRRREQYSSYPGRGKGGRPVEAVPAAKQPLWLAIACPLEPP